MSLPSFFIFLKQRFAAFYPFPFSLQSRSFEACRPSPPRREDLAIQLRFFWSFLVLEKLKGGDPLFFWALSLKFLAFGHDLPFPAQPHRLLRPGIFFSVLLF